MRQFIDNLNSALDEPYTILACCCGHNKYRMTIIVKGNFRWTERVYDLVSGETINRRRKFYKKDKEGYYYIPEAVDNGG